MSGLPKLREIEKAAILDRLELLWGNKKATAASLGISRKSLYNKLAYYGLSTSQPTRKYYAYAREVRDERLVQKVQ